MKANKPKAQKKDAKKVAKKELERSLTSKILEVVKHFGQDAERVGKDVELVSKFLVKKLSKKFKDVKSAMETSVDESPIPAIVEEKVAAVKKSTVKVSKTAKKVVEQASKKAKPVVQSVKMAAIATEEKAAEAIAKPAKEVIQTATETVKPVVKKAVSAVVRKTPVKAAAKAVSNPVAKPKTINKTKTEDTN